MRYTGSYHSIGYFFDGIRKLERIIHITSFSLEAKEAGQKRGACRLLPRENLCFYERAVATRERRCGIAHRCGGAPGTRLRVPQPGRNRLKQLVQEEKNEPVRK